VALPTTVGGSCAFEWRGEETSEGQMIFGKGNSGTLTFLGNRRIRGFMSGGGGVGQFEFSAEFDPDALSKSICWVRSVRDWKNRWRAINSRSYEAANKSRWGGRSGDAGYQEPAANSDTTACGESDDDNEGPGDGNEDLWESGSAQDTTAKAEPKSMTKGKGKSAEMPAARSSPKVATAIKKHAAKKGAGKKVRAH
jgi:hypothetical protein